MPLKLSQALRELNAAFDRVKARVLGRGPKRLVVQVDPAHSLAGIFRAAAQSEGDRSPGEGSLKTLLRVAEAHVEAVRERAKAELTRALAGEDPEMQRRDLADVQRKAVASIRAVVDTEATAARNLGAMEGQSKVAAAMGLDDPVGYFVTINDSKRCEECVRLHLMEDKITPRLWRRSEIGAGYHRKGDANPKVGGLHPSDRCTWVMLLPGFGFGGDGRVRYVAPSHDALAAQRAD